MTRGSGRIVRVRALAKINLSLRVLGLRRDGYHELRTVFQSIALHDTLTCVPVRGPFSITCDDPQCPTGERNLVWCAAEAVWRHARKRQRLTGMRVDIRKRVPIQSGLGGGSSDAAAALRALPIAWGLGVDASAVRAIACELGADVAYFLEGGSALGVNRGDYLFPLIDSPRRPAVVVVPPFGVSTKDAFTWWDGRRLDRGAKGITEELRNDLQTPVNERHPEIGRLIARLRRLGASSAAMSGSGSSVFGLFESASHAGEAAARLQGSPNRVFLTETVSRQRYERLSAPRLSTRRA